MGLKTELLESERSEFKLKISHGSGIVVKLLHFFM